MHTIVIAASIDRSLFPQGVCTCGQSSALIIKGKELYSMHDATMTAPVEKDAPTGFEGHVASVAGLRRERTTQVTTTSPARSTQKDRNNERQGSHNRSKYRSTDCTVYPSIIMIVSLGHDVSATPNPTWHIRVHRSLRSGSPRRVALDNPPPCCYHRCQESWLQRVVVVVLC